MKIHLAEKRGFCAGVERAVRMVEQAVAEGPYPVRVLHEIVHNEDVVDFFRKKGVEFYDEIDPSWTGGTLIFSAHGVGTAVEDQARKMNLNLVDATCPLVHSVHKRAASFESEGRIIIFIGKRGHRETEGVAGRLKHRFILIENRSEAESFQPEPGKEYAVLSQTTLGKTEYEAVASILKAKIPGLVLSGGICAATSERQDSVRKLAEICSKIIVIGSENSSNSRRLRETAEEAGARAVLIPRAAALPEDFTENCACIGITSGASAPEYLVEELIGKLKQKGGSL